MDGSSFLFFMKRFSLESTVVFGLEVGGLGIKRVPFGSKLLRHERNQTSGAAFFLALLPSL